jgi:putative endonuclease
LLCLKRRKLLTDKARLGRWGEKRCAIVFVEVKTRAGEDLTPAESVVTFSKKIKALKTARYFLAAHRIDDRPYRFDVVTIILGQTGPPQIRHYPNAFVPQKD